MEFKSKSPFRNFIFWIRKILLKCFVSLFECYLKQVHPQWCIVTTMFDSQVPSKHTSPQTLDDVGTLGNCCWPQHSDQENNGSYIQRKRYIKILSILPSVRMFSPHLEIALFSQPRDSHLILWGEDSENVVCLTVCSLNFSIYPEFKHQQACSSTRFA